MNLRNLGSGDLGTDRPVGTCVHVQFDQLNFIRIYLQSSG